MANSALTYPEFYIDKYGFWNIAFKQFLRFLIILFIFYFEFSFLIPRFLSKKKYKIFAICSIFLLALGTCLFYARALILDIYFAAGEFFVHDFSEGVTLVISEIIFYMIISAGAKFSADWFKSRRLREELAKEKALSELAMLRYQISPHFLYNTLHNINYLVGAAPERASESIVKLSEIMRYMLREENNTRAGLESEMEYVRDFIDLQKIRMKNPDIVNFTVEGDPAGLELSPLLFISFIENAFKHGDITSEGAFIDIKFEIDANKVIMKTSNRIDERKSKDDTKGVGICNVKRRLEILYPGRYNLEINQSNETFGVKLTLDLS